jgi:hypothetical protein
MAEGQVRNITDKQLAESVRSAISEYARAVRHGTIGVIAWTMNVSEERVYAVSSPEEQRLYDILLDLFPEKKAARNDERTSARSLYQAPENQKR